MAKDFIPMRATYDGISPVINGDLAFAGGGAVVLGRVTLGDRAWLGAFSVLRADGHDVIIGDNFHLGDHATVHIAHDIYPTNIGDHATVGSNAVIHACDVGDGCVVEQDAVILDGASVGAGAVISKGAVVFPRSQLEGGWLYTGSPAKPVKKLSPAELDGYHQKIRGETSSLAGDENQRVFDLNCFVAHSAQVQGQVSAEEGVGIWYGCHLNANTHRITIGAGSNVQDNSILRCKASDIVIGPNVTIGHNVTLSDCTIEQGSLIGIGAVIAAGTVVESDVLVAAGAQTEAGQRLTKGKVWAGRPAREIGVMDDKKREMMSEILSLYRAYAISFHSTPHKPLTSA
ncbi:MAG: gamma carbonic anhydrase family protein [Hyphomicrobiales bacterium]